ncbi:MAG TPA: hypothetical protein VIE88_18845, partial [Vicinamibacteria bacterium]
MRDPGLEAFVEGIETHLRLRRGAERHMSPPDFARARTFYRAGVSLAEVLTAIDEELASGRRVVSLAPLGRRFG